jgi:hypothetical protein
MANPEITNWRDKWDLEDGPKGSNWKFDKNAPKELKNAYSAWAVSMQFALQKNNLSESDAKWLKAQLQADVAIGEVRGDPNWKGPFANSEKKFIGYPPNFGKHHEYGDLAPMELAHMLVDRIDIKPPMIDRPNHDRFGRDFAQYDPTRASNLNHQMSAAWVEQRRVDRQQYGFYDHDYEYWGLAGQNRTVRLLTAGNEMSEDARRRSFHADVYTTCADKVPDEKALLRDLMSQPKMLSEQREHVASALMTAQLNEVAMWR